VKEKEKCRKPNKRGKKKASETKRNLTKRTSAAQHNGTGPKEAYQQSIEQHWQWPF